MRNPLHSLFNGGGGGAGSGGAAIAPVSVGCEVAGGGIGGSGGVF
jgi:hypothetical protein